MAKLDAQQVADLLLEIGRRASLEGGNPYKSRAYIRAAESLRTLVVPLDEVIRRSQLRALPGIGDAIARRIMELRERGTDEGLEKLRAKYPAGLLELLSIPRLKPSVVIKLHKELGIASLLEAEAAAREGRFRKIKGLGASLERKILEGAALARGAEGRMRANRAEELLEHAAETLRAQGFDDIRIAGDLRRGCEVISDLRLVGASASLKRTGHTRVGAVGVDIVSPDKLGGALLYATGSERHLEQLEDSARDKRLALSEDGLGKPGGTLSARTEQDIYRRLGLSFIPPELREGNDEVQLARARKLPSLIEQKDLQGRFTFTPTSPMASTPFGKWPKPPVNEATAISASPITRSRHTMRVASPSMKSFSSMSRSMRSIRTSGGHSASSRALSPTSAPTAPSTTPTTFSPVSILSWPASTAGSAR